MWQGSRIRLWRSHEKGTALAGCAVYLDAFYKEDHYFGFVIISKSSLRNGVTGRPSTLKRLQIGLSAQA